MTTVSQRLAHRLQDWFARKGHGWQAKLVAFSRSRPGGSRISAQNLSYFLNERRLNAIDLDDLDDLAAFFNVSMGELLGEPQGDLSGEEERLVWLWRGLPLATRHHLMGLLAPAALSTQSLPERLPPIPPTVSDDVPHTLHNWVHD